VMKNHRASLNVRAWVALAILALVMGLLLFVPAGTVDYWQAWFYLAIFFGGGALLTLYLVNYAPRSSTYIVSNVAASIAYWSVPSLLFDTR
jgi:hypothetical protein